MSHNRASQPQAVFSHETALTLYNLSDANPAHIHLTVPPHFRRRLSAGVVIHRGVIPPKDWEERDGCRVTTPLRTLVDIAADPTSWMYLESAVRDALRQGMVRSRQLQSAEATDDAHARLVAAVAVAGEHASTAIYRALSDGKSIPYGARGAPQADGADTWRRPHEAKTPRRF